MIRTLLLPVRVTLGASKLSAKTGFRAGRLSARSTFKVGRLLGFRHGGRR